jgi:hypothetical protein
VAAVRAGLRPGRADGGGGQPEAQDPTVDAAGVLILLGELDRGQDLRPAEALPLTSGAGGDALGHIGGEVGGVHRLHRAAALTRE